MIVPPNHTTQCAIPTVLAAASDLATAATLPQESVAIGRALDTPVILAQALYYQALTTWQSGDYPGHLAHEVGARWFAAYTVDGLAATATSEGHIVDATRFFAAVDAEWSAHSGHGWLVLHPPARRPQEATRALLRTRILASLGVQGASAPSLSVYLYEGLRAGGSWLVNLPAQMTFYADSSKSHSGSCSKAPIRRAGTTSSSSAE